MSDDLPTASLPYVQPRSPHSFSCFLANSFCPICLGSMVNGRLPHPPRKRKYSCSTMREK